jgi:hypothetical protein
MNHADSPVLHGHDWAVAAWTILVMAMVLGIVSNQMSRFFTADEQFREHSIGSAAKEMATVARLAVPHHETFPAVMTIPFAVTRTQRMMVARAKHRDEVARHDAGLSAVAKTGPRLLTGLAILGASQSSSH